MNKFYATTLRWLACVVLFSVTTTLSAQCFELECHQNVPLQLGANCTADINGYFIVSNNFSCGGPTDNLYFTPDGDLIGDSVTGDFIGMTLPVLVTHTFTGVQGWGSVVVQDGTGPTIECENISVSCAADVSPAAIGIPAIYDNCGEVTDSYHQDELIDFGCGMTGFSGYFDPDNWTECYIATGDGTFITDGAPDSITLVGVDNAYSPSITSYVIQYKITVPTSGYVTFDWCSYGGNQDNADPSYLTVNDVCVQLNVDSLQCGSFTTWALEPGDILSFEQGSNGDANTVSTTISNFTFVNNALQVINRTWTATDNSGNVRSCTQVITRERAGIDQVVFPQNFDGNEQPALACGADFSTAVTGLPVIDTDGNPATTADQIPLDAGDCTFALGSSDQILPTCSGSQTVLRTFSLSDWCTGQVYTHTQIINVFDQTAPVISCPGDLVVSTDADGCFAAGQLPLPTATDNCSDDISLTANWSHGSDFDYSNVPTGTYPVTYVATDACGNSSTCVISVTVEDQVDPQVICDGNTATGVTTDGMATVSAIDIDDGSYDNCCLDAYLVKLEDAPDSEFAPEITFSCGDTDGTVMVTMRVVDCAGNFSDCSASVNVQDNIAPTVVPPAGQTVDCSTDLSDPTAFGVAQVFDNCDATLSESSELTVNDCGTGTLVRTFTAADVAGNVTVATQTITIENQTPWNSGNDQIVWPVDFTTDVCGANLDAANLPAAAQAPVVNTDALCADILTSVSDDTLFIAFLSCYVIQRNWSVVDFCQYTPGEPEGRWDYTQQLTVEDNDAPQFVNLPSDTTYLITNSGGCGTTLSFAPPATTDCSDHVSIAYSSDFGAGFGPFFNVGPGSYQVQLAAFDDCGNSTPYSYTVTVADGKAPSPICMNGAVVELMQTGSITVAADLLNLASFDNCTAASDLSYSFSADVTDQTRSFTCADLGPMPVQIYVTDAAGNQDFCETFINIQDNTNACGGTPEALAIGGTVRMPWDDAPVGACEVILEGNGSLHPMTGPDGNFLFENLTAGANYQLRAEKHTDPVNGVTVLDIIKIKNHVLGLEFFSSPYQYIAADANGSGSISSLDMAEIQAEILGLQSGFPDVGSWQFVDADHVFTASNPLSEAWPGEIFYDDLNQSDLAADLIAVKTGDLNQSVDPSSVAGTTTEDRSGDEWTLSLPEMDLKAGDWYALPLRAERAEALLGLQARLRFDPSYVEWQMAESDLPDWEAATMQHATTESLSFLWYNVEQAAGEELLTLRFRVRRDCRTSEVFHLAEEAPLYAYERGTEREYGLQLRFIESTADPLPATISLETARPNPWQQATKLPFALPEAATVSFEFFDARGRQILSVKNSYEAGQHALSLTDRDLPTSGVILYRMRVGEELFTGRMVRVR